MTQQEKAKRRANLEAILKRLQRDKRRAIASNNAAGLRIVEAEIKETYWDLEAVL